MEKILISFVSALLGFLLSQSFNFVSYLRRPRFRVRHWTDGVLSSYTGDPPETPWEIELGFFLENYGKNPAKNTRIFVSDIKVAKTSRCRPELTSIELLEIKRPLDFIPSSECVKVKLGSISGVTCELALDLDLPIDEDEAEMIGADTRGSVHFSAKFHITCDEKNSSKSFTLDFRPDQNEWASSLLEDYTEEYLDSATRPIF